MEAAAALPRSEVSFRRQGSSGLIWDDKLLSGELKKISTQDKEDKKTRSSSEAKPTKNHRSSGNLEPSVDPPSPKVSGCGVCGMFGKPVKSQKPRKTVRRKS